MVMRGKNIFIFSLVLLISLSFVSAGIFDWLTGNYIKEPCVEGEKGCIIEHDPADLGDEIIDEIDHEPVVKSSSCTEREVADSFTKGTSLVTKYYSDRTIETDSKTDYCVYSNYLSEFYCSGVSPNHEIEQDKIKCENGCSDGACIKSIPVATCENGVLDGDETGIDCGGSCDIACVASVDSCNYYVAYQDVFVYGPWCEDSSIYGPGTGGVNAAFAIYDETKTNLLGHCYNQVKYKNEYACLGTDFYPYAFDYLEQTMINLSEGDLLDSSICEGIWNSVIEGVDIYEDEYFNYIYYTSGERRSRAFCFDEILGLDEIPDFNESEATCKDSDGGLNYYVKGTLSSSNSVFGINEDTCATYPKGAYEAVYTDSCKGDECIVVELFCNKNIEDFKYYNCPNGCQDGACRGKVEPMPKDGILDFNEDDKEEIIIDSDTISCDNGCLVNDKCLPYGYRKSGDFCSTDNKMIIQQDAETACENNFQCGSNLCIDSSCVSASTWQKIMTWFSRLF